MEARTPGRAVGRRAAAAWLLLAGLAAGGCGTINSYASGCPAPWSGVRTDREYLRDLEPLPEGAVGWLMVTGDLPLSAIADTLTLPLGAWVEHPPPTPVSPGCRWAIPRR